MLRARTDVAQVGAWEVEVRVGGANFGAAPADGDGVRVGDALARQTAWTHDAVRVWAPAFDEANVSVRVGGRTTAALRASWRVTVKPYVKVS